MIYVRTSAHSQSAGKRKHRHTGDHRMKLCHGGKQRKSGEQRQKIMTGPKLRLGPASCMDIKCNERNGEDEHGAEQHEARQAAAAQKMPRGKQAERENEREAKLEPKAAAKERGPRQQGSSGDRQEGGNAPDHTWFIKADGGRV